MAIKILLELKEREGLAKSKALTTSLLTAAFQKASQEVLEEHPSVERPEVGNISKSVPHILHLRHTLFT